MASYTPAKELMDLVRCRFCEYTNIVIVIIERRLDDRLDHLFVQTAKPSGNMTEADDGIPADFVVVMPGKSDTDVLSEQWIRGYKSHSDTHQLKLNRVIPYDRSFNVIVCESFEILEFHDLLSMLSIIEHAS